jgi:predicted MFS family arabinose efflux permease
MTSSSAPAVPTRAIILTACATFGATANLRVADSLLPQVATEFGTTVGQASIIVTVYALAFGCFQMFYGPIGDRLGKLRVIMGVAFASALVTGLSAFMPTLHTLAGARFLTAVASAAIVPLGMAWVGDVVPYDQRQGVLARFLTGQIMGMAFGQAVGGVLGDLWGWRSVFGVLAAVHFLGGLGLAIEIWRNPQVDSGTGQRGGGLFAVFRSFASVLKRPWARTVLLGVFLEGGAMFGAFAYVGADLHHRFGLDIALVGTLLIAYGFGGVIYAWTARPLLVRLGERGFAVIGGALVALGFVTLAVAPSAYFAVPAILLMGYAYYMLHNTLQTNGTQMAPEARGVAMSLFASCFFLGQSTGVLLASLFIDSRGTIPIYFASAAALTLIGIWFAGRLRHRP